MTIYVNNETLGNVEYIGSREEFREAMRSVIKDWFRDEEYENRTFEEYEDACLARGLHEADDEQLARCERVVDNC